MKKTLKLIVITALLVSLLSGCSSDNEASASDASQQTTTTATETALVTEATQVSTEATEVSTTVEEPQEEVAEEPEFFTVFSADKTSMGCLTYEGSTGTWAHLINPYNSASLFEPVSSMKSGTENIVICFNVSGVLSEMTTFCGLLAYGTGEDDDELQVWSNDTYNELCGEDFEFVIAEDGYYEMTVPVAKLAEGLDYWEGLDYVSIVEVAFFGAEKTDEAGEYLEVPLDGLEFEFLGIRAE